MQVNLPRGLSARDATAAAANIAANESVESKDVQDAISVMAEAALEKQKEAMEALEPKEKEVEVKEPDTPDKETIKTALVRVMNVVDLVMPSRDVKYEVVDDVNCVQVQVVKKDGGEVIRKIPEDKILQVVRRIHAMLNSEDEKAIDVTG